MVTGAMETTIMITTARDMEITATTITTIIMEIMIIITTTIREDGATKVMATMEIMVVS